MHLLHAQPPVPPQVGQHAAGRHIPVLMPCSRVLPSVPSTYYDDEYFF
ncbi:MAG: hypothetical protein AB1416_01325 [Actinomycetota bacterium]